MAWPIWVDSHNDKRIKVILKYCENSSFDKFYELMVGQGFIWTNGPFKRRIWWCWGN